MSCLVVE